LWLVPVFDGRLVCMMLWYSCAWLRG